MKMLNLAINMNMLYQWQNSKSSYSVDSSSTDPLVNIHTIEPLMYIQSRAGVANVKISHDASRNDDIIAINQPLYHKEFMFAHICVIQLRWCVHLTH